eukprot:3280209-Alexandrium_andersonii.AAC.1
MASRVNASRAGGPSSMTQAETSALRTRLFQCAGPPGPSVPRGNPRRRSPWSLPFQVSATMAWAMCGAKADGLWIIWYTSLGCQFS